MKSVKNMAELASARGEKPEPPAPKPAAEPAIPHRMAMAPLVSAVKTLSDTTNTAAAANQKLLEQIVSAMQKSVPAGAPPWNKLIWNIERDENGLMTRITTERE